MANLPLIEAVAKGELDKVRQLLESGHNVNERGEPLSKAELKSVKRVLNMANMANAVEAAGRMLDITPLMAAAENGSMEVTEALLQAGADVNAADSLKRTALMIAIEWKHEAIAQKLIDAGADVNAKDLSGRPVLTQAIELRLLRLAHALLDAGASPLPRAKEDCMPLTAASQAVVIFEGALTPEMKNRLREDAIGLINRLLDEGAKPTGVSVLGQAIWERNIALATRLIQAGSPLRSHVTFMDPLVMASVRGMSELVRVMLAAGARAHDVPGASGLLTELAKSRSQDDALLECAGLLLEAGANVNHADSEGFTPLRGAVSGGCPRFARWLLDHGAEPNPLTKDGGTPLDLAYNLLECREQQLEMSESRSRPSNVERRQEMLDEVSRLREFVAILESAGGKRGDRI
jgi:uncharacterized protein